MLIEFANGTANQRNLFQEAMRLSLFDWDRITTTVVVTWVPEIASNFENFSIFAETQWTGALIDRCGRPDSASIQIREDMDDPDRTVGGEQFRGNEFYMETVHHELGHVVQSKFSPEEIAAMAAVFDGTVEEWDHGSDWTDMRQESYAETFKDVWLPRRYRKFDCRAKHRLQRGRYEDFLHVLDDICPCVGLT